jgi:uncharacterized protein (DUF697 family)
MVDSDFAALPYLDARNRAAETIISETARNHALLDAAVDAAAGLSPIPFTSGVALGGQLLTQVKHIYPQMIKKLAVIYGAEPPAQFHEVSDLATVEEALIDALILAAETGLLEDLAGEAKSELAAEFGQSFLIGLIQEALKESAAGLAVAQIPWVGVPAGAAVAAQLAYKLTWRVGITLSIYFQNGCQFLGGKKATMQLVKTEFVRRPTGPLPDGQLDSVRRKVPPVMQRLVDHIRMEVNEARLTGTDDLTVRTSMLGNGYPSDIVDAAMA